jgi:hypothetical protein
MRADFRSRLLHTAARKVNGVPGNAETVMNARPQLAEVGRLTRLGHSVPRMTLGVYTHVTSEDDVRMDSNLDELLGQEGILDSVGLDAQKEGALPDYSIWQGSWLHQDDWLRGLDLNQRASSLVDASQPLK